jgi:parallel beta-helix repeat protein
MFQAASNPEAPVSEGALRRLSLTLIRELNEFIRESCHGLSGGVSYHDSRMNAFRHACALTAVCASLLSSVPPLHAATSRYVNISNPTPASPFTSWATAAANIQDAIDAAAASDEILVTNGVYQTGARAVYGASNRVAITRPIVLRSVNGPESTRIVGYQMPGVTNGPESIRCVYLTNGAVLAGFTLAQGATLASGDSTKCQSGGGVFCDGASAVVSNCVIAGNVARSMGGGAYYGTLKNCRITGNTSHDAGGGAMDGTLTNCVIANNTARGGGGGVRKSPYRTLSLYNCTLTGNAAYTGGGVYDGVLKNCVLTGNTADSGGGAYLGTLNNCTLTGNHAEARGGGAYQATLFNCILYYNDARIDADNWYDCFCDFCCTVPLPEGTGNLAEPPLLASGWRLSANSPCLGHGSAVDASGVDLDGERWRNPPSIGCDEFFSNSLTGALSIGVTASFTNVSAGCAVDFQALIDGRAGGSRWDFGDGTVILNQPWVTHTFEVPGDYVVEARVFNTSLPLGVAATVSIHVVPATDHYVAVGNTSPRAPYDSWATAATNIQDALDAAFPGATIWVSDGVYQAGATSVNGHNQRVAVTKPVTLRSVHGPTVTHIVGAREPGSTNGPAALRCVYLTNWAVLEGFTLSGGATQNSRQERSRSGGGVWCDGRQAVVTNCVLVGNAARGNGGAAYGGTLRNCMLENNSAHEQGGGAAWGTLLGCAVRNNTARSNGGGAYFCALADCVVEANTATQGGGSMGGNLDRCTLVGNSADTLGGGAHSGTLSACVIADNAALSGGGGVYAATVQNSSLARNRSGSGGGAYGGTLDNCTVTLNTARGQGGGAFQGTLNNCVVYFNEAGFGGPNYSASTLNSSCSTPLPPGAGNIAEEPALASSSHLSAVSPCIGRGSAALAVGTDIDGEPWKDPPSMGCDEFRGDVATGDPRVAIVAAYTNVAAGFAVDFQALVEGRVQSSRWDFGDGAGASNRPAVSHAWVEPGDYLVELRAFNATHPAGVTATVRVRVVPTPVHYVALDALSPVPPFDSWIAAATNIQDAVHAATFPGALVCVSNGVYRTGAVPWRGMSNRLAVTRPVIVQSANGPEVTRIEGYQQPGTTNGEAAVRCVYLANGAVLSGFTLAQGATLRYGNSIDQQSGGGVLCEGSRAVLSNCVLTANAAVNGAGASQGLLLQCTVADNVAASGGGGTYGCTLEHCIVRGNAAGSGAGMASSTARNSVLELNRASYGGGAYVSDLTSCTVRSNAASNQGGGVYGGTANRCLLEGNTASTGGGAFAHSLGCTLNDCTLLSNAANYGGGAYGAVLNGCLVTANTAVTLGGGIYNCPLTHCTVAGNSAASGGGVANGNMKNCIVYYNSAGDSSSNHTTSTFAYSCTAPLPTGSGNISSAPLFLDTNGWSNLRLQTNSPCVNAGRNTDAPGPFDLDGRPRVVDGRVDMGAFESQGPGMAEFIGWLARYSLPTDGSVDFADPDGDRAGNWQEWRCATIPTNAASALRLLTPQAVGTNVLLAWESVEGVIYGLERGADPSDVGTFRLLASNIVGTAGITAMLDTNAPSARPQFYRVHAK